MDVTPDFGPEGYRWNYAFNISRRDNTRRMPSSLEMVMDSSSKDVAFSRSPGSLRPRSCASSVPLAEIRGMRLVNNTEDGFAVGADHDEHFHSIYATVPSARR